MTNLSSTLTTRRSLLAGSAGLAGAALLAGCGPTGGTTPPRGNGESPAAVQLPKYVPYGAVAPDIPAPNEYCLPGYLKYPSPAKAAIPEKPGDGTQTITGFTNTSISVAPPMEKNNWWTNLNQQMGVTLSLTWVKGAEFLAKVQTMIASGDLPDVMLVPSLPRLDQVLTSKFLDITPYVAGDAITDYPMLANFSTLSWQNTVYNGSIFGISRPVTPITPRLEARTDTMDQLGVKPEFSNGEEFLGLCREITDRKAGRFAMCQPTAFFFRSMFDLPNEWEKTDQGFRHEIESPRFVDYLTFVAAMWKEGLFHPESFQNQSRMQLFQKPAFLLYEVGGAGFTRAMPLYRPGAPTLTVKPVAPPLVEGGGNGPTRILSKGGSLFALRKGLEPDKVKLILRTLNYCAAPFGTKEFLTVQYGKEGYNYDLDSAGQPIARKSGANEIFPITLFPGNPPFNYAPGFNEVVEAECAYEAEVSKKVVLDASTGLFSAAAIDKDSGLTKQINIAIGDIIQGRKPVSDWAQVVKDWAARGGDEIRKEYEEAAAR